MYQTHSFGEEMVKRLGSNDGAFQGYTVDEALGVIVGGKSEPKKTKTKIEMKEYIEDAPDNPQTYDETARAAAKIVLSFLERHPEAHNMPADSDIEFDGKADWNSYHITREGLSDYIKRIEPELWNNPILDELTGFMWGWAVNAARSALNLSPVPNPALLTIQIENKE